MISNKSFTCAVVCFNVLIVPCCVAFSYTPIELNPSIETLVQNAIDEKGKIIQNCIDRASDRLLALLGSIARMLRTELDKTQVDILNNRALDQTREYTNDIRLLIDQTEKALDVAFKYAQSRIEQTLGNKSRAVDSVEDVFTDITSIVWSWQNGIGRLLYDTNERGQQIVDGLAYEALDSFHQSGWSGLEQALSKRRDLGLDLVNRVSKQILTQAKNDDVRIREWCKVLLDAGR